ncbi:alpha/beta hydrolase [Microbacterium awajiense]|uniref:Alpha/beta hydrolase n=1 Tax=Microbacterium awajiense TaxID=415214 RepID=A0ABP7AM53_9MICO
MRIIEQVVTGAVRGVQSVSASAAASLALRLFMRVGTRMPLRDEDEPTMSTATRWAIPLPGVDGRGAVAIAYEWGRGPETVVLVHGWQGRASQFAPMVRELRAEGLRVVALEMPAHGEAPGERTYLPDFTEAIAVAQRRYGPLHGLVGHSFGGMAVLTALADGIDVDRVMTVAAPAEAASVFGAFRDRLGIDARTAEITRARFADRYFDGADPFAWASALRRPLPPTDLVFAHDRGDRQVPFSEAERLGTAHPHAALLALDGTGHSRILRSDAVLDAALALFTAPGGEQRATYAAAA